MKGLLIDVNFTTGERAGEIDARNCGFRCLCQNMESTPGKEIRLLEHGEDIERYRGVSGITVLNSDVEINACVDVEMESQFGVDNEALFAEALRRIPDVQFQKFRGRPASEVIRECYDAGTPGVYERKPQKLLL